MVVVPLRLYGTLEQVVTTRTDMTQGSWASILRKGVNPNACLRPVAVPSFRFGPRDNSVFVTRNAMLRDHLGVYVNHLRVHWEEVKITDELVLYYFTSQMQPLALASDVGKYLVDLGRQYSLLTVK